MMTLMIPVIVIFFLIALNGFFVAAEFALIGTPRTSIEKEADEGNLLARRVVDILQDPRKQDKFIATAQLGITVASLGLGMYGEHTLAKWLDQFLIERGWDDAHWVASHSAASLVAISALTYLHIVLGEMVPKSLALQGPQRVVKWIAPIMLVFQWVVYPLVLILNGIGSLLLRIVGVRSRDVSEQMRTPEELSYIVDESETGGELGEESANVLRELLEFGELTAGEAMVPRTQIVGIENSMHGSEIKELLRKKPHTRYLVYENDLDKVLGFIHVKDLLRSIRNADGIPSEAIRPVPFVPASSSLESVLRAMRKSRSQLTVVMDEHGGTAGLLTVEDLFEEVVGEISEDSAERPEIQVSPDGNYIARGTARVTDLGEELGVDLEHEFVDSVSGLILALLERPAQVGDEVSYRDIDFKVSKIRGRGVAECIVRLNRRIGQEN